MKTILAICAITLVVGAAALWHATRMPSHYGTFTGAPEKGVVDLIKRPSDFLGTTVAIEGEIRQQCKTMGCFFYFVSGKNTLRVDLQEIAMRAPMREGRKARVEGRIVPYAGAYQFYASAVEFE